jgi:hypothetical protein
MKNEWIFHEYVREFYRGAADGYHQPFKKKSSEVEVGEDSNAISRS